MSRPLPRRAVLATAWSVPAVVAVGSAPAFATSTSDLSIRFDYSYWEMDPTRMYVCTLIQNNGTTTTGPLTITVSAPVGFSGEAWRSFGTPGIPETWLPVPSTPNVVQLTVTEPLAPGDDFHTSYWWTLPAGTNAATYVAAVAGGAEGSGTAGDNAVSRTYTRPALGYGE